MGLKNLKKRKINRSINRVGLKDFSFTNNEQQASQNCKEISVKLSNHSKAV